MKRPTRLALALSTALFALPMAGAQASGFALIEQNASGLGNAYAGQAASAQDASTVFFNPAGLTQIEGRQVVLAGHYIMPSAKLTNSGSTLGALLGTGGDAGQSALVPNAYYAMEVNKDIKFGLGINAPFGLGTEYDAPWLGQTQGIKSDVKTLNLNPSLAWKASDKVSLGLGLNWQRIDAELTQSATAPSVTLATMKGDDDSWGWNAGAMFKIDDTTRVGLAYRSQIKHQLEGTLTIASALPITADITLPATASLSLFKQMTPAWDLLADVTWTGWSSFDELRVKAAASGGTVSLVTENWENTWRYSLGANHRMNEKWTYRFGLAFDQAPVPDAAHRTPRIPDQDRTWLAIGGQYKLSDQGKIDFGYAHLFVKDALISHTESGVTVSGTYANKVDIVSVQYTHSF